MLKLRRGRVVFISSVVGLLGSAGQTNYAASKAGLVGLARSLARELGSRGITSNVVAPGFVETDMTAELPEDLQKTYHGADPARPVRLGGRGRAASCASSPATTPATSPGPSIPSTADWGWGTERWRTSSTASGSSSPAC